MLLVLQSWLVVVRLHVCHLSCRLVNGMKLHLLSWPLTQVFRREVPKQIPSCHSHRMPLWPDIQHGLKLDSDKD